VATITDINAQIDPLASTHVNGHVNGASAHSVALNAPTPTGRFTVMLIAGPGPRRELLSAHLASQGAAEILAVTTGAQARARATLDAHRDLVVVDGGLPDGPVLPLLADLRRLGWRRVVLLTPRTDAYAVRAALTGGVRGYLAIRPQDVHVDITSRRSPVVPLQRNSDEDSSRVDRIGLNSLSRREIEVLTQVSQGMSNKDIGEKLGLSALTVKSHLARIARKLGTGDRAHMVALLMRAQLIR
jgi:DNA-binding NarL/FixJ family response regulator